MTNLLLNSPYECLHDMYNSVYAACKQERGQKCLSGWANRKYSTNVQCTIEPCKPVGTLCPKAMFIYGLSCVEVPPAGEIRGLAGYTSD